MDCVYGLRLLASAGKPLNEEEFKKLFDLFDTTFIKEEAKKLLDAMAGRDLAEIIEKGKKSLVQNVVVAPSAKVEAVKEEKKEEKKAEPEEDEDFDMFGGF
ncbi:hypothetical protein TUBRATIS_26500 [Tubulinosema ratisbonensis]|uniref:60S acidic ribosomal protein P2 n=1 Tax=Tubulinosema ratisbonensis TaxID=291195 RepID=A0A437AID5_9MICR|nr:hypothetical protein TUBRATIS_26500 [Tubulinosema ratisbonensis]